MPADLDAGVLQAWRTNSAVNVWLVEGVPAKLWSADVPGIPRRSIRRIAAHLHNARCRWIKTLGREHGISAPAHVDYRRVSQKALVTALGRSSRGIEDLLRLGIQHDGVVPPSRGYVWRNLPLDVGHVLTYFIAHEAHHRGQIVMAARQLGQRLPSAVVDGLWQWARLAKNAWPRRATIVAFPAEMHMSEPKTRPTRASAGRFLSSIKDPKRRADCRAIAAIMKQATRTNPKMWGSGMVGFGTRTIKYAGGREAEWMRIAFAPRKDRITLYVNTRFPGYQGLRAKLGKTSGGKACIHIKTLTDVHLPTLRKLVVQSIRNVD